MGVDAPSGVELTAINIDSAVVGSLDGGGGLGDVDLIFVPEPSTIVLLALGLLVFVRFRRA